MTPPKSLRPVWAEVDLGAVRHNASRLAALARPGVVCAVVKANGYGHGAVPVARAALEGGATWLGVALVEEGVELRDAGIEAPILVLSEPPLDAMDEVVGRRLTPTVYTEPGVEAAAKAVAAAGIDYRLNVHVKVDTGMHRVGAAPEAALGLADAVNRRPELRLAALWTHLAVADEPDNEFTADQLERFERVRTSLQRRGVRRVESGAGLRRLPGRPGGRSAGRPDAAAGRPPRHRRATARLARSLDGRLDEA